MDVSEHTFKNLFLQLGLPDSEDDIEQFIARHRGIDKGVTLHEADFWNMSQSAFLSEAIADDSDWAEVVDHLDVLLRD
jgi:hypothetical protein